MGSPGFMNEFLRNSLNDDAKYFLTGKGAEAHPLARDETS
jgi:hypothetical protein